MAGLDEAIDPPDNLYIRCIPLLPGEIVFPGVALPNELHQLSVSLCLIVLPARISSSASSRRFWLAGVFTTCRVSWMELKSSRDITTTFLPLLRETTTMSPLSLTRLRLPARFLRNSV